MFLLLKRCTIMNFLKKAIPTTSTVLCRFPANSIQKNGYHKRTHITVIPNKQKSMKQQFTVVLYTVVFVSTMLGFCPVYWDFLLLLIFKIFSTEDVSFSRNVLQERRSWMSIIPGSSPGTVIKTHPKELSCLYNSPTYLIIQQD